MTVKRDSRKGMKDFGRELDQYWSSGGMLINFPRSDESTICSRGPCVNKVEQIDSSQPIEDLYPNFHKIVNVSLGHRILKQHTNYL